MPRPTNLSAMSVDALLKLREDINKTLNRKAKRLTNSAFDVGRCCRKEAPSKFAEGQEGPAEISQPIR
jgi:hypothetical protein